MNSEQESKTPAKKKPDLPNPTHYHVVVRDSERNRIRFGPFTCDDPETEATSLSQDIREYGIEAALQGRDLWGGLQVSLVGDNDETIALCEIPTYP